MGGSIQSTFQDLISSMCSVSVSFSNICSSGEAPNEVNFVHKSSILKAKSKSFVQRVMVSNERSTRKRGRPGGRVDVFSVSVPSLAQVVLRLAISAVVSLMQTTKVRYQNIKRSALHFYCATPDLRKGFSKKGCTSSHFTVITRNIIFIVGLTVLLSGHCKERKRLTSSQSINSRRVILSSYSSSCPFFSCAFTAAYSFLSAFLSSLSVNRQRQQEIR